MTLAPLLLAAALQAPASAPAVGPPPGALPPGKVAILEMLVGAAMAKLGVPGVAAAVVDREQLVWAEPFGLSDVENAVPVRTGTMFRLASVSKPITATAVMQLVERGKLDLDAPIQRYVPSFPEKPWPITPRLLLAHLGGVRHYSAGEFGSTRRYESATEALQIFKDDALAHEPGTRFLYTSYGYNVLGCAVEGASKMPFAAYLQANVFDKAGMTHTAIDDLYQIVPKRVRGYLLLTAADMKNLPPAAQAIARPDTVYNTALHDTSMKLPGGGFVSTPSDYVRFVLALLDHTLAKQSTLDAMWTSQKTRDGVDTEYGFGFGVQMRKDGKNVSHSGNQAGAASLMRISPERRAVLVIMTNLEDAPLGQLANQIGPIVLGPAR